MHWVRKSYGVHLCEVRISVRRIGPISLAATFARKIFRQRPENCPSKRTKCHASTKDVSCEVLSANVQYWLTEWYN